MLVRQANGIEKISLSKRIELEVKGKLRVRAKEKMGDQDPYRR